jgi:hypothetical protein
MIRLKSLLKESNEPLSKHPKFISTGIQFANSLISVGFSKIEDSIWIILKKYIL